VGLILRESALDHDVHENVLRVAARSPRWLSRWPLADKADSAFGMLSNRDYGFATGSAASECVHVRQPGFF